MAGHAIEAIQSDAYPHMEHEHAHKKMFVHNQFVRDFKVQYSFILFQFVLGPGINFKHCL